MVSRDSIRIIFLLASLHGVDITAIDLDHSYLNVTCAEKIFFLGGDECGDDKGHVLIIFRGLYGIKSADLLWRSVLAVALREIGLKPTMVDPKFWIRAAMRPD